MARKISTYVCQNCGSETSQYFGKCMHCNEWNTIIEEQKSNTEKKSIIKSEIQSKSFDQINIPKIHRIKTGFEEFDRVLGGGFVNGSVVLLGGEPGIGKSTLILQASAKISLNAEVLYITAEESLEQVKMRWERLNQSSSKLKILSETNLSSIISEIRRSPSALVIVDSIQAIYSDELESSAGSVSQVRSCSSELQKMAKELNFALLIIGHITKEGSLAGPKTLEHLVDVVMSFEGDQIASHRLLRSLKNRFGPTKELGIFEMIREGLKEVKNPSSSFTNHENISGVATTITNEGTRSFAVDIQALVNKSFYNNPRRTTTGVNLNRLHQILAVIEKHLKFKMSEHDCYLATAGGFAINDPCSDLGVAISIISSLQNNPPMEDCTFIGEIGLSGQVRQSSQIKSKIEESIRLQFKNIMVPKMEDKLKSKYQKSINIIEIKDIKEAINISLKKN